MSMGTLKAMLGGLLGKGSGDEFKGSADYWRQRYATGGNSGAGSYNKLANFKAAFLNEFVVEHGVKSVIEHGCGDGNQLTLANYPTYLGYDISPDAIKRCKVLFADDDSRQFQLLTASTPIQPAELHLSLDVIYHLVEDGVYEAYMAAIFIHATRYVIIYSTDNDTPVDPAAPHVRHRKVSTWVERNAKGWRKVAHKANDFPFNGDFNVSSNAEFFVYER